MAEETNKPAPDQTPKPENKDRVLVLEGENAALKAQILELENLNKELQEQLEKVSGAKTSALIVNHGKESYKVLVASFKFKGQEYKAEDLKKDTKLVKTLIDAEVGFLVKL